MKGEIRTLQKRKGDLGEEAGLVLIFPSWTGKGREAEGVGSKSERVGREKAFVLQIIKRDTILLILSYILKGRSKLLPNIIGSNVTRAKGSSLIHAFEISVLQYCVKNETQ